VTDPRNATRDAAILAAARTLALDVGLHGMTRAALAERSGLSAASVSNFGITSVSTLRHGEHGPIVLRVVEALMRHAVDTGDLPLVAAGIAARHPVALGAPEQMRIAALTS
jgi:hypothetical protein